MQKLSQLSLEQSYKIEALKETGYTQTKIVEIIVVNKSTISRELKRNTGKRGIHSGKYYAQIANNRTRDRHRLKFKMIKFTDSM